MEIISALCLGALFGFVLHRVGASNPQKVINMLRLTDLHLMKVILLGIALASAILFVGLTLVIFDPARLSVKTSYWGVIIGQGVNTVCSCSSTSSPRPVLRRD